MQQQRFAIENVMVIGTGAAVRELCRRNAKRDEARRAVNQVKDGVISAVFGGAKGDEVIEIVRVF